MSPATRRELKTWGRALGFVALIAVTAALLVAAGLSTI